MSNEASKQGAAEAETEPPPAPAEEVKRMEEKVEAIRENLGGLVGELDHRRHEALDFPLQLRRHARPLAIGLAAVLGLAAVGGLAVYLGRRGRRSRPGLLTRLAMLRHALARAIDDPRLAAGERAQ